MCISVRHHHIHHSVAVYKPLFPHSHRHHRRRRRFYYSPINSHSHSIQRAEWWIHTLRVVYSLQCVISFKMLCCAVCMNASNWQIILWLWARHSWRFFTLVVSLLNKSRISCIVAVILFGRTHINKFWKTKKICGPFSTVFFLKKKN